MIIEFFKRGPEPAAHGVTGTSDRCDYSTGPDEADNNIINFVVGRAQGCSGPCVVIFRGCIFSAAVGCTRPR